MLELQHPHARVKAVSGPSDGTTQDVAEHGRTQGVVEIRNLHPQRVQVVTGCGCKPTQLSAVGVLSLSHCVVYIRIIIDASKSKPKYLQEVLAIPTEVAKLGQIGRVDQRPAAFHLALYVI